MKNFVSKRFIALVALFAIYISAYLVNRSFGGYWLKIDRNEVVADRDFSTPASIAVKWQTRFGDPSGALIDPMRIIFFPLAEIDRHLFRPTIYLTDDGKAHWLATMNEGQIHPMYRTLFREKRVWTEQGAAANP